MQIKLSLEQELELYKNSLIQECKERLVHNYIELLKEMMEELEDDENKTK